MSFILLGILNAQAEAAGEAGAYDLLETTILSSDASSVSFTGLGSYTDYKHLQIRFVSKTTETAASNRDNLAIRFNSDTSTAVNGHRLRGQGGSVTSSALPSSNGFQLFGQVPRNNSGTGDIYGAGIIDILDFSSATKNTTLRCFSGDDDQLALDSVGYFSTSAITNIEITDWAGESDLRLGSRFSLYGMGTP